MTNPTEKTLSWQEYQDLLCDSEKLAALEAGGVDNWEWYSESLQDFYKKWYPEELEEEDEDDEDDEN